jgi:flavodoxin
MKKALIIYHSKTGRTRTYAEKIGKYIQSKEIEVIKTDLEDFKNEMLNDADYIFFGCWTHGLFVILQHPDKEWADFASLLKENKKAKTALFTTYKILTGSMFNKMKKKLNNKFQAPDLFLKSKTTELSGNDKAKIDLFIKY